MHEILISTFVHIDTVARSRGYSNGTMLATFFCSTDPQRGRDAVHFIAWRDRVLNLADEAIHLLASDPDHPWNTCQAEGISPSVCNDMLDAMRCAFISGLPPMEWPSLEETLQ